MKHPSFRKLLLISVATLFLLNLKAQNDSITVRKNSFAVNVNGLLAQIFNNNYSPQSFLTYRRHFQKWNLRVGVGGYYNSTELNGNSPTYFTNGYSRVGLRTGFELPLLKYNRWHGYVGMDGVGGFYQYSNVSPYDNGETRKRSGHTWSFGLSPLFGLNFQLNQLIGFGVESSYDFLVETGENTIEYTYNGVSIQTENELYSGIYTSYSAPIRLNMRVCF